MDNNRTPAKLLAIIIIVVSVFIAIFVFVPLGFAQRGSNSPGVASTTFIPLITNSVLPFPQISHIYVLIMENKEYSSIVGNTSAPYINSLIAQYALATNYTGVAHPSQPNYVALFSGSTQGVIDNGTYDLSGTHLADQLEAKGKTWKVFAQNVPLGCFTGATSTGGVDDPAGLYVRKHEPAISFTNISGNPPRCANITNFSNFDPAVADFELIVPNNCNNTHDCSIAIGDAFLQNFVPGILTSPAWQNGGVLFLTWDEGTTTTAGGGQIVTLVISRQVTPAFKSSIAHSHYSLLRTIQDAWSLGCLNNSCTANNLREFFP